MQGTEVFMNVVFVLFDWSLCNVHSTTIVIFTNSTQQLLCINLELILIRQTPFSFMSMFKQLVPPPLPLKGSTMTDSRQTHPVDTTRVASNRMCIKHRGIEPDSQQKIRETRTNNREPANHKEGTCAQQTKQQTTLKRGNRFSTNCTTTTRAA